MVIVRVELYPHLRFVQTTVACSFHLDLSPIFGFARLTPTTPQGEGESTDKKRKNKNREKTFGADSMNAHLHFKTMPHLLCCSQVATTRIAQNSTK